MSDVELKPCPFCGGEAKIARMHICDFLVKCTSCYCMSNWYKIERDAIKAWNRRTPEDPWAIDIPKPNNSDEETRDN